MSAHSRKALVLLAKAKLMHDRLQSLRLSLLRGVLTLLIHLPRHNATRLGLVQDRRNVYRTYRNVLEELRPSEFQPSTLKLQHQASAAPETPQAGPDQEMFSRTAPTAVAAVPTPAAARAFSVPRGGIRKPAAPAKPSLSLPLPMAARARTFTFHRTVAAAAAAAASPGPTNLSLIEGKNVVDVLMERGLVDAITNEEELRKAAEQPIKVYCGFDPTADSLHLGNLLGILVLVWFQRCGHTPVALLGGATGRVGDPSGKSAERPVMDDATIEKNVAGIKGILAGLLQERNAPVEGMILNNLDWFGSMGFLEFLRDVGKFARMGTMLNKDSVRTRLDGDGMSFTEFTYQLLQGYDMVHLYKEHQVCCQIGGSDQWGNITAGTDLMRRLIEGESSGFGLTFPLLLKSDGTKFGKSESGAVWLAAEKLGPYKFYQYLFAVPDTDVIKFMKMLTFMELDEIADYEAEMQAEGYRPNTAQMRLAEEVTKFVHGEKGLTQALKATEALRPGSQTELDTETLEAIADDVPNTTLTKAEVANASLVDVLVAAGLQKSKGEARRMIKQGGISVNNIKIGEEDATVGEDCILDGRLVLLAAGKKNKMLVRVQ